MRLPRNTIGPSEPDQPQEGEAERRLARAGFADDAHGLALADPQGDAVDRLDVAGDAPEQAAT